MSPSLHLWAPTRRSVRCRTRPTAICSRRGRSSCWVISPACPLVTNGCGQRCCSIVAFEGARLVARALGRPRPARSSPASVSAVPPAAPRRRRRPHRRGAAERRLCPGPYSRSCCPAPDGWRAGCGLWSGVAVLCVSGDNAAETAGRPAAPRVVVLEHSDGRAASNSRLGGRPASRPRVPGGSSLCCCSGGTARRSSTTSSRGRDHVAAGWANTVRGADHWLAYYASAAAPGGRREHQIFHRTGADRRGWPGRSNRVDGAVPPRDAVASCPAGLGAGRAALPDGRQPGYPRLAGRRPGA